MANNSKGGNKDEPSNAPDPNRWYNLSLGSSFKKQRPSSKFCSLRYEFKPASIDKSQPGTLRKNKDNRVTVEFQNNQVGKPKVTFEGSSEDYKENDAVLFFDGETFRLERLHRAVKRLRHVRKPGESSAPAVGVAISGGYRIFGGALAHCAPQVDPPLVAMGPTSFAGQVQESYLPPPPPVPKGAKYQASSKGVMHSMPFEVDVERIDIGDTETIVPKHKPEKAVENHYVHQDPFPALPDPKNDEMDEDFVDILNADDDDCDVAEKGNAFEKELHTGIDINIPHQNDMDDEIADVDVSDDDDASKGPNAAEALRAQVNANADGIDGKASSSSSSSGSDSSGSGSGSGSGSSSSSSDSESSDDETVVSI